MKHFLSGKRILILCCAVAAAIISAVFCIKLNRPQYHYELSDELRFSFENADEVIERIREALEKHDYRIHIKYHAEDGYMDDVEPLVDELFRYALSDTESPTQGDYIRYQYGGYKLDYSHLEEDDAYTYYLTITPVYYTDPDQEECVDRDVSEILKNMNFTSGTSEFEKVRMIYDYVRENVSYDTIHKSSEYHLKSTAYAALERKTAGCQGYAVLMYRLLKEAGIGCRIITGMAEYEGKTEYHAWNIVRIGGIYYNMDVTWDSWIGGTDYFLRGSRSFTGHVMDAEFSDAEFLQNYPVSEQDYQEKSV